ncbi:MULTISPECIES: GntR family transcriptional regulator [Catellatospora]|uniref:GntR family transcriptional regulator n=1 Tax=Catellatospora chokoriensis TaxID=310353 RepID=A0A8J3JU81_9ACTN|nr:GntR family transcriptional regulator [Catellatospora chokoriensis]GIF91172.1 GntR family transcriptional regulator [Catellatospora chokoriensis]
MFAFRLDSRSGVPTYLQLVEQVRRGLLLGYLVDGEQLPTVREVAAALVVNPNTVAKAYRELERAGLAAPRAGQGTFVIAGADQVPPAVHARLSARLRAWVRAAHEAGLAPEQIRALVTTVLDDEQTTARAEAA